MKFEESKGIQTMRDIYQVKTISNRSFLNKYNIFLVLAFCLSVLTGYARGYDHEVTEHDYEYEKSKDLKEKNRHRYMYVQANYLDVSQDFKASGSGTSGGSSGFGINLGYSFYDYFAFELSHLYFGEMSAVNASLNQEQVSGKTTNLALVGKIPLGRFEPFAKIGYSRWSVNQRIDPSLSTLSSSSSGADGSDLYHSFGAQFSFMRGRIDLVAEMHQYSFKPEIRSVEYDWDVELFTFGIKFNF